MRLDRGHSLLEHLRMPLILLDLSLLGPHEVLPLLQKHL
jgi:hypothetical protein